MDAKKVIENRMPTSSKLGLQRGNIALGGRSNLVLGEHHVDRRRWIALRLDGSSPLRILQHVLRTLAVILRFHLL